MKQLLDTHTFIWFVTGNNRISDRVRAQIENNDNFLSIASLWEIAKINRIKTWKTADSLSS